VDEKQTKIKSAVAALHVWILGLAWTITFVTMLSCIKWPARKK